MKLLTATRETQGTWPGDFCHAIEGELVVLGWSCGCDDGEADGDCGCGRAFTGTNSLRATTSAMVRDLELTVPDVQLAVEAHLLAAGLGPDVLAPTCSPTTSRSRCTTCCTSPGSGRSARSSGGGWTTCTAAVWPR
ncbi:DUF7715 family protein [Modestobacter marinus]|uniref:DUF7715 family protein n=1 Tax=Modestobacter marinus TaxID=477641 RepID=UPI001C946DC1|nr:hypothetical protein [Modestobacter marinus]